MQRQRGESVPIGDAVADLDSPVTAIRKASPQARHQFTRFDHVNQLTPLEEVGPRVGGPSRFALAASSRGRVLVR